MKFGLIGKNISYSFSKDYFTKKFKNENLLNYSYHNIDIGNIEKISDYIQTSDYKGFNVTVPYKQKVIRYLDELSDDALQIGAVNTIVNTNGQRIGYNTDWIGFWKSLEKNVKNIPRKALILGSGGASLAVKFALEKHHIEVVVANRTSKEGAILLSEINQQLIAECLLIVHTTPVGTFPDIDKCLDLPYHALTKKHVIFDLIYNPKETLFLNKSKDQGAQIINGYDMLIYQAEAAWDLWMNKV